MTVGPEFVLDRPEFVLARPEFVTEAKAAPGAFQNETPIAKKLL